MAIRLWLAGFLALLGAAAAQAHPVPLSYLDLDYREGGIDGRLTFHASDIAHDLGIPDPHLVLHAEAIGPNQGRIAEILFARMELHAPERLEPELLGLEPLHEEEALLLTFRIAEVSGGELRFATDLFPHDPQHQTFVNIYEDGELRRQWILSGSGEARSFYPGTREGAWSVMRSFVPAGIQHILIGPDHLLFLVALLLLGGSLWGLVKIITAFTLGHSVTLALAALDIVTLPAHYVEPAIALTIIVVGADNLLRGGGRDLRVWMALAFGLIHGFGFAGVLREFGLPQEALGWSLFSFNVGVELGQLAFVVPVAILLARIKRAKPDLHRRVAVWGSVVVIAAGTWWFVERVFLVGGI